jgi:hypothetical protein
MEPIAPITRKSMESGLLCLGAVSENRRPESSVSEVINFDFDSIGSATLRKGLTRLGSQLSGNILGIYYFIDTVNASPKTQFMVVNGTAVSYLNAGSYTSIRTGLTGGSKARFSTFLNFAFMVNGTEATAVWDGNTGGSFATTGNALNAPTGKYIENYRSRMWIAGNTTYPSRVWYSSVPSAVTTPVITWDTNVNTGQWIDISPSDGESVTALHRSKSALLVFKQNHIYKVYSITQTDPDPRYDVGTSSQESIVETKNGMYFHHLSGFYQYNLYGIVQEISRPIIDIIRAIPSSAYTSVAGWLDPDGEHINWSVGTVTVRGITYTNMVVRYSISTQVWTTRTYPNQILNSAVYDDGTTRFKVVGDNNGNTYLYNYGITDDGTQIPYLLTHGWEKCDGLLSTRKTIMQGMFSHEGGTGTNINYQVDGDPDGDWSRGVGQFKDTNTGFNTMSIKARKVRFRISGTSKGQPFIYNGYELIGVTHEFLQFSN